MASLTPLHDTNDPCARGTERKWLAAQQMLHSRGSEVCVFSGGSSQMWHPGTTPGYSSHVWLVYTIRHWNMAALIRIIGETLAAMATAVVRQGYTIQCSYQSQMYFKLKNGQLAWDQRWCYLIWRLDLIWSDQGQVTEPPSPAVCEAVSASQPFHEQGKHDMIEVLSHRIKGW